MDIIFKEFFKKVNNEEQARVLFNKAKSERMIKQDELIRYLLDNVDDLNIQEGVNYLLFPNESLILYINYDPEDHSIYDLVVIKGNVIGDVSNERIQIK